MIKTYLLSIIVILSAACPSSSESIAPDRDLPSDNNHQYPNGDMRVWQNMTAAYKNMRDVASESNLSMTKVRNFAASGNKLLMSINSISRTVGKIWEKTGAYEKIFGFNEAISGRYNGTEVIDGMTINIKDRFSALGVNLDSDVTSYNEYINVMRYGMIDHIDDDIVVGDAIGDAKAMTTVIDAFKAKYKRLAEESATDARVYKFASTPLDSGGSGAARRYVIAQNAMADAVAGTEMRNAEIDAEALHSVIMMVNPAIGREVMKGAVDTKTLTRNRLAADLRGIETQRAAVNVMGQILMSKLIGMDSRLYQSVNQAYAFDGYKKELNLRRGRSD